MIPPAKPSTDDSPKVYGEVCQRKQRRKRQKLLLIELLYDYAKNSTLHGLRYIVDRSLYIIEKLFWLLTFISSVGMCFYLISNVWVKWSNSPVIVTFSERAVPVSDVPYPSITICPQLKVKSSVFNFSSTYGIYAAKFLFKNMTQEIIEEYKQFKNEERQLNNLGLVCGKMDYEVYSIIEEFSNETVIDDLMAVAPNISDVFFHCLWRGDPVPCEELFDTVLTREGVCFNFNSLAATDILRIGSGGIHDNFSYLTASKAMADWSVLKGYSDYAPKETYPKRGRVNNAEPDLSVILQEVHGEKDDLCNNVNSGYTIYVQHPADLPQARLYYYAALPGYVSSVALKFKTTMTDKNLESYPAEVRQCYFPYEKQLKYFKIYTPNNCRLECESKYTFKRCGCVWFHMPYEDSRHICTSEHALYCLLKAYEELSLAEIKTSSSGPKATPCGCLPSCVAVEYDAEILKTKFNFQNVLKSYKKLYNATFSNNETLNEYSKVDVYFKSPRFVSMRRSELFGLTDFLANCGGLLGLFLGFSFLSLVEIFYFFSFRLFVILRRDLQKEENKENEDSKKQ